MQPTLQFTRWRHVMVRCLVGTFCKYTHPVHTNQTLNVWTRVRLEKNVIGARIVHGGGRMTLIILCGPGHVHTCGEVHTT